MKQEESVYIKKGEMKKFSLPDNPKQAPTFFEWSVDFGGGEVLINDERDSFFLKAEERGRHVVSFIPSTTQGDTLMSAQYTGCGEEHEFLVVVK